MKIETLRAETKHIFVLTKVYFQYTNLVLNAFTSSLEARKGSFSPLIADRQRGPQQPLNEACVAVSSAKNEKACVPQG